MSNTTVSVSAIGFMSVALLFSADYEGDRDLLDAVIDYTRAHTAVLEHQIKETPVDTDD